MFTSCSLSRAAVTAAAAVAVLTGVTACNIGGLSANSTCADYNKATSNDQVEVVRKLYHQAHSSEPESGPGAANAVFNVGYECSQNPSATLRSLGDFRSS